MDTKGMNMETVTAEKLNTLLDWVGETTKSAQGFMLEQAPLVAQEIVAWEFWSSLGTAVLCFAISTLMVVLFWKAWKTEDADIICPVGLVTGLVFLICTGGMVSEAGDAIKAKAAPRLVIIEYVGKAVK